MKKYMIILLASLAFTFVACDNDTEPGVPRLENGAGDWWVTECILLTERSRRSFLELTSANEYLQYSQQQ